MRDLAYPPLPVGLSELSISTFDTVFDFDTGRSYFKAFALPRRTGPLRMDVIAPMLRIGSGGTFQPDFTKSKATCRSFRRKT